MIEILTMMVYPDAFVRQAALDELYEALREEVVAEEPDEPDESQINSSEATPARSVWDDLADCESGNWVNGGESFEEGSARWHVAGTDERAQPHPPWSNRLFYGGLQFTLESWEWAADVGGHDVNPNPANNSREQQIAVAETLLEIHPAGWGAWPTCTKRMGLR